MNNSLYVKLQKMREAIKKEEFNSFPEFLEVVNRKAKHYKVLPLYCFYGDMATLSIVDIEDISLVIKFQIPVELIGLQSAKQYLYKMAFDVENVEESITPKQFIALMEKMKEVNVTEKEIMERYKLKSLADMTPEIYNRCMTALKRLNNRQQP